MVGTSFVKPNIDKTLYLWSKNAKKVIQESQLIKYPKTPYTAPSPDITFSSVNTTFFAYYMFDGLAYELNTSYLSGSNYNKISTFYEGSASITDVNNETYLGEWVRIDLKENIILREYKISPQNERLTRAPGNFRIYGSTDNINHHFIDERTNQTYTTNQSLTFSIPNNQEGYRYYTIIVHKLSATPDFASVAISEWELYGVTVENTEKCIEYNWDIPEITLNQSGKISMEAKAYNSFTPSTTAVSTRIKNVSSKYNYDTANGGGTILNIGHWGSKSKMTKCPPIPLQPQSINEISLSLTPENNTEKGLESSADFVVVLKITEDDVPPVEWGNSKAVNVRQLAIPTYN